MTQQWLKYVPHGQVGDYKAAGWYDIGSCLGHPHRMYATLMEWRGTGDPVMPPRLEKSGEDHSLNGYYGRYAVGPVARGYGGGAIPFQEVQTPASSTSEVNEGHGDLRHSGPKDLGSI